MSNFRKLKMEDLIAVTIQKEDTYNVCTNQIPKNQKDFGHKKRIKP
jgi:hypothetical protein